MTLLRPLFAFLAGLAAGLALVYANPLVGAGEVEPLALITVSKSYRPEVRGFELRPGAFLGGDAGGFEDPANRYARLAVTILPAGEGFPAALAVKASVLSDQNSLWRARLGTVDYWTVAWPGEGAVFVSGYSNYWPLLKDLFRASLAGRPAALAPGYPLTALPPTGHWVGLLGATGRFAGQPGDVREHLLPKPGELPGWQLDLRLDRARQQ